MKNLLVTLLILIFNFSPIQNDPLSGIIEGYKKLPKMKMVSFSMGMENPIDLGSVKKGGTFSLDLTTIQLPELSEENREMFIGQLYSVFEGPFFSDDFGDLGEIKALNAGYLSMLDGNNQWAGSVFPVTNEEIKNWMEDPGYNNAVSGSWLELIYVEEAAGINISIARMMPYNEEEIPVEYHFDLELVSGFNWVQYDIEQVYVTDPTIRADFPTKVSIHNLENPSQFRWIGKFF